MGYRESEEHQDENRLKDLLLRMDKYRERFKQYRKEKDMSGMVEMLENMDSTYDTMFLESLEYDEGKRQMCKAALKAMKIKQKQQKESQKGNIKNTNGEDR